MEKFPIFEIETTDNKITIHGAVGSIVFYDYAREEAVKQYRDHFNKIRQGEAVRDFAEKANNAAEAIKGAAEAIKRMTAIFGGIYGI